MDDSTQGRNMLTQVGEGMDVYDIDDRKVGTVAMVNYGSLGSASPQNTIAEATGPATGDDLELHTRDTFVEDIAEAFSGDRELPETVRSRMLREGYVRVDTSGFFRSDRFILPEQIVSVSDDRVQLSVPGDDLIHR